mmetsp:Transcript_19293/g.74084  ORF Transcript_19293/g.74084 Transcript_19293/m.74084 type:complete len:244 (+) Transcript_19293:451-1182(+)
MDFLARAFGRPSAGDELPLSRRFAFVLRSFTREPEEPFFFAFFPFVSPLSPSPPFPSLAVASSLAVACSSAATSFVSSSASFSSCSFSSSFAASGLAFAFCCFVSFGSFSSFFPSSRWPNDLEPTLVRGLASRGVVRLKSIATADCRSSARTMPRIKFSDTTACASSFSWMMVEQFCRRENMQLSISWMIGEVDMVWCCSGCVASRSAGTLSGARSGASFFVSLLLGCSACLGLLATLVAALE